MSLNETEYIYLSDPAARRNGSQHATAHPSNYPPSWFIWGGSNTAWMDEHPSPHGDRMGGYLQFHDANG